MHVNPARFFQTDATMNPSGKEPPSMAARAFLENNDDWADQPFGKLVSLFARGEDIPPAIEAGSTDSSLDVTPDTTNTTDISS